MFGPFADIDKNGAQLCIFNVYDKTFFTVHIIA
jgi:hypothetical protein